MPKGRRGGRRAGGGASFRTEAEAEVYALNELKKAGVDRYKGIPDHGVTSKAANRAVDHVDAELSTGAALPKMNITKRTAREALKIEEYNRLSIHQRFMNIHGITFEQYKKALNLNAKATKYFKSKA